MRTSASTHSLTADRDVLFADPYGGLFANSPHPHSRVLYTPPHYTMHPLMLNYHYNYPPYPYLLPPGNY